MVLALADARYPDLHRLIRAAPRRVDLRRGKPPVAGGRPSRGAPLCRRCGGQRRPSPFVPRRPAPRQGRARPPPARRHRPPIEANAQLSNPLPRRARRLRGAAGRARRRRQAASWPRASSSSARRSPPSRRSSRRTATSATPSASAAGSTRCGSSCSATRSAPGDEVIVPSNTFIATWLAVSQAGATPVPVEPDPATHNVTARGRRGGDHALDQGDHAGAPVRAAGRHGRHRGARARPRDPGDRRRRPGARRRAIEAAAPVASPTPPGSRSIPARTSARWATRVPSRPTTTPSPTACACSATMARR